MGFECVKKKNCESLSVASVNRRGLSVLGKHRGAKRRGLSVSDGEEVGIACA